MSNSLKSNPRPLGYIKPNVIKSILRGETPNAKVGYEPNKSTDIHLIGEQWTDSDNKTWIQRDGYKESVGNFDSLRKELNPYMCPQCGKILRSRADEKFMKIRNKCTDCVVTEDGQRIVNGTMAKYEKEVMLNNGKSFYLDVKVQMEEYIAGLKPEQQYINEDGTIEKWSADVTEMKTFLTAELKEVNEMLEKIDKELAELSTL